VTSTTQDFIKCITNKAISLHFLVRLIRGKTGTLRIITPNDVLTLSARPPLQNLSTPCILNVNKTGAKIDR
jgi:hypothetical protein